MVSIDYEPTHVDMAMALLSPRAAMKELGPNRMHEALMEAGCPDEVAHRIIADSSGSDLNYAHHGY